MKPYLASRSPHRAYQSQGFTLIELLVCLSIIGILTATMVPSYTQFRKRAYDQRAQGDLRSVALAEEAYFLDTERYVSCSNNDCANRLPSLPGLSLGTVLSVAAQESSFVGRSLHPKGSGRRFVWDSERGGMLEQSAGSR